MDSRHLITVQFSNSWYFSQCLKSKQIFQYSYTFLVTMCLKSELFAWVSDTFMKYLKTLPFCLDFRNLICLKNRKNKKFGFKTSSVAQKFRFQTSGFQTFSVFQFSNAYCALIISFVCDRWTMGTSQWPSGPRAMMRCATSTCSTG